MAGLGSRFRKAGYNLPKYMINAKNKTLFEWSMESLLDYNPHVDKYIFVVRKEDDSSEFIRNQCSKYDGIDNLEIVEVDYLTDGQATTCMLAIPHCNIENPIMVYNIDTYIEPYELKYSDISGDGHIPCFKAQGDSWSFVKLDENGTAIEVREKERISDYCTLGAYYFSSAKLFRDLYEEYYKNENGSSKNEKYIAPLYNYMIKKGMEITISLIESYKVHVLGTPEQLEEFINEQDY
jgi:dTDP-glucose pyrophosphorylase